MLANEFVTVREACRRTGIGQRQFKRAISDGALAVYDVGAWPRLRWSDVMSFIQGTRRAGSDRPADAHHARERDA
jgi:excisionase family DNA binding protein